MNTQKRYLKKGINSQLKLNRKELEARSNLKSINTPCVSPYQNYDGISCQS